MNHLTVAQIKSVREVSKEMSDDLDNLFKRLQKESRQEWVDKINELLGIQSTIEDHKEFLDKHEVLIYSIGDKEIGRRKTC